MRGSITRVSRKDGSGCILAEDGKEVCFERSEASNRVEDLRVGTGWSSTFNTGLSSHALSTSSGCNATPAKPLEHRATP